MAWQEPTLDWSSADRFTFEDMNRICGNLNDLAGDNSLKTTWTNNDFLSLDAWKAVTARITQLTAAANLDPVLIDTRVTAENIQAMEQATADVKIFFDLVQKNSKYPLYTNQAYAGMTYARGGAHAI